MCTAGYLACAFHVQITADNQHIAVDGAVNSQIAAFYNNIVMNCIRLFNHLAAGK